MSSAPESPRTPSVPTRGAWRVVIYDRQGQLVEREFRDTEAEARECAAAWTSGRGQLLWRATIREGLREVAEYRRGAEVLGKSVTAHDAQGRTLVLKPVQGRRGVFTVTRDGRLLGQVERFEVSASRGSGTVKRWRVQVEGYPVGTLPYPDKARAASALSAFFDIYEAARLKEVQRAARNEALAATARYHAVEGRWVPLYFNTATGAVKCGERALATESAAWAARHPLPPEERAYVCTREGDMVRVNSGPTVRILTVVSPLPSSTRSKSGARRTRG